MSSDASTLREAARRTIWQRVGREPEALSEPITLDYRFGLYPHQFEIEDSDEVVALDEIALEREQIVSAVFDQGFVGGVDEWWAYDLGDDFWYIASYDSAGDHQFEAIVRKDRAEPTFQDFRRYFVSEYVGTGTLPAHLDGFDLDQPSVYREMVHAIESGGDDALYGLEYMVCEVLPGNPSSPSSPYVLNSDGQLIFDAETCNQVLHLWRTAVKYEGSNATLPVSGLCEVTGKSSAYVALLGKIELAWGDTGEPLSRQEAEIVRHLCQYLAVATR